MCQLLSLEVGGRQARGPAPRTAGAPKRREVGAGQLAAPGVELLEPRQLAEADARRDVGQVELPADQLDLHAVEAGAHDALEAVLLGELRLALVVEHQAAALGRS